MGSDVGLAHALQFAQPLKVGEDPVTKIHVFEKCGDLTTLALVAESLEDGVGAALLSPSRKDGDRYAAARREKDRRPR